MSVIDDIRSLLAGYNETNFDPAAIVAEATNLLDRACAPGGEFDIMVTDEAEQACHAFGGFAQTLLGGRYAFAAESLLIKAWNMFGERQRQTRQRVYRAGLAMHLTLIYQELGDMGAAFWWALHTQADDVLGEHPSGGGAGRHVLLTRLRMTSDALSSFNDVASANLVTVTQELNGDWSCPAAFAEDVVRRFAVENREYASLFSLPTPLQELPLSKPYFAALLSAVTSASADQVGRSLETLTTYLFLLVPGWVPWRNVLHNLWAFESDVVVRNLNPAGNITAELLGRHFIVECKNLERRVAVVDVGFFLYRMKLTHSRFGVIIALEGISGEGVQRLGEWAGNQLIRNAFHEDGSVCVVITLADLRALLRTQRSFWSLLLEKIESFQFGHPRSQSTPSDLRKIAGIGTEYERRLIEEAGIHSQAELLAADPEELAPVIGVRSLKIRQWQSNAS
ncbi:MAG: hypothetical protein L0332_11315 [Chloroflexi bacterium]|nr:hypothetical protein [Chloroflexota bacterium]MCI0647825.1 hypothetical protein [Chloroflexota bacterium]MCI0727297.1 hypothetical protein [Chloroflexota bacterium]